MCVICMASPVFDPTRHEVAEDIFGPSGASISEMADAAAGTSTGYAMAVGDSFQGTIGSFGDRDWVAVTLTEGTAYDITLAGAGGGGGSLSDTYLRVYNSSGSRVAFDDDDGPSFDSFLDFTASYTGTYYIAAGAWNDSRTGTYTMTVEEGLPATAGTVEEMAQYLQESTRGFAFTFDTTNSNVITVNLDALTADGQQLARWAMEAWEMVVDIDFVEVASGNEQITVDDAVSNSAWAYLPGGSEPGTGVEMNVGTGWLSSYGTTLDSYSFQTYIHEFGHALGLNHQGNYNGSATYGIDDEFVNDSWQMSVMSYFSQAENTSTNASYALLATAMMVDVFAIQGLYGAPDANSATAGDTTYGLGSNLGNYMDEIFAGLATGNSSANFNGNKMAFTIYDRDGTDTINLSFLDGSTDADVNLQDGTFSDFGNLIGIMGIAVGTVVENLITGAGDDTITGNQASNQLTAGAGNDEILSGAGDDTAFGGAGNDTIYGGGGNDIIETGAGTNEAFGGSGDDELTGGSGIDILGGGDGNDTVTGGEGNDQTWGSSGNDFLYGNQGDDLLGGGSGIDQLFAGDGNDEAYGAGGRDTVQGGEGDDTLGGGFGRDNINGGTGND
ncbi:MAG: M10 family metallopeptidase, partial [Pseudomonadota bacterium]